MLRSFQAPPRADLLEMTDRLTLSPDLLPHVGTQLDSSAQTLRSTADQLTQLETSAASTPAATSLRSARLTLTQTGDGLNTLRADVTRRAALLGVKVPPPAAKPAAKPAPSAAKPWWETTWSDITGGVNKAWNFVEKNKDIIHAALNVVGMIPVIGEVANAANGLLYLSEGDYTDFALSAVSLIPLAADGIAAARLAVEALGYVKDLGVAEKLVVEGVDVTRVALTDVNDAKNDESLMSALFAAVNRDVSNVPEVGTTIDALSKLDELSSPTAMADWQNLDDSGKLDLLKKIEETHAGATDVTSRDPVPVNLGDPSKMATDAGFDPESNQILVKPELFDKPLNEVVEAMTHEGRHAFQDFWGARPDEFTDPTLARAWADNMKDGNYIKEAKNPIGYYNQPVEYDAIPYGKTISEALFPGGSVGDFLQNMDNWAGGLPAPD